MSDQQTQRPQSQPVSTHRTCSLCRCNLPRSRYSKKQYLSSSPPTCRTCKTSATASRLKVVPPRPPIEAASTLCNGSDGDAGGRVGPSGAKRRPNNFGYCTYVDWLFGLQCFGDIVRLGVFNSAKDVSESMAALHAACRHGNVGLDGNRISERDVLCLCIGDGATPRTAVLVAFLKGWNVVSIDPNLRSKFRGRDCGVRGFTGFGGTLDEFMATKLECGSTSEKDFPSTPRHLVLLCVHSHARFLGLSSLSRIRARYGNVRTTLVSLPCCARFRHIGDIGRDPDVKYDDDCVFSACRSVEIWNFEPGGGGKG